MSELYPADWTQYLDIGGVFLRMLGLLLACPALAHRSIPTMFKILFALAFSLAMYPLLKNSLNTVDLSVAGLLTLALRESLIGLMMGFIASLTFEAINLAAHFVGYQMGFGTVGLMDPQSSSQVSTLVPIHGWMALMVFWFLDLHHDVLQVFCMSFQVTSHLKFLNFGEVGALKFLIEATAQIFLLAIRLAAPFTLLLLACQVAMGILARLLPQMNLLLFSFPLTLLTGFAGLYLLAPEYLSVLENVLSETSHEMIAFVKLL